MNIVVCVSQTPDTTTKIKVGESGRAIDPAGVKFILNPYDEFAVEEGLRLKEAHGGEVTLLCVGGDSAKENIRLGLAPLYTTYKEIYLTLDQIRYIMSRKIYERYPGARDEVT